MHKEFLPYETVRNNALKMAYKIYNDGFVPDVIYVSLRGGAYLANVVSEFFKIVRRDAHPVLYAAVVARSYSDIRQRDRVMVDGGLILRNTFVMETASCLSTIFLIPERPSIISLKYCWKKASPQGYQGCRPRLQVFFIS